MHENKHAPENMWTTETRPKQLEAAKILTLVLGAETKHAVRQSYVRMTTPVSVQ